MLDNKKTLQASIKLIKYKTDKSLLKVVLQEGRNRQIRRIANLLNHPVIDLQRTAIGNLSINNIKEGSWREVNISELSLLKASKET